MTGLPRAAPRSGRGLGVAAAAAGAVRPAPSCARGSGALREQGLGWARPQGALPYLALQCPALGPGIKPCVPQSFPGMRRILQKVIN